MLILLLQLFIVYNNGLHHLAYLTPSSANLLHKVNKSIQLLHMNHSYDPLDINTYP